MRSSRKRGLLSRAVITALFLALLMVGLPVGPPVTSPGGSDLGLGRLWGSVAGLFSPDTAAAAAQPAPAVTPKPPKPPEPPRRVRELVEKRSATTKVFALSDGRTEVEISPEPQHFRDGNGEWSDIDTSVVERGRDGYRFGNASNRFRSDFGDRSDRLVRFEAAGKRVAMGIVGESRELLFEEFTVGGKDVTPEGYNGVIRKLEDGTEVGLREHSLSGKTGAAGNATIDIKLPGNRVRTVHIGIQ